MDIRLDNSPLEGRHYETGTLRNAWAIRGAKAPHTGEPYSEALLLGVSGGITFGYFTFAYKGWLPHVALLTRNTFDPFDTILERLAPPREVRQTADAGTAERHLREALEAGYAPIVWADTFSLPYYGLPSDAQMWMMRPVVVVGHEDKSDHYLVADGARQPWRVAAADLSKARGRVKKDRYRLMTLEPPNPDRLPSAVQKGLWQCISLFTEDHGSRTSCTTRRRWRSRSGFSGLAKRLWWSRRESPNRSVPWSQIGMLIKVRTIMDA